MQSKNNNLLLNSKTYLHQLIVKDFIKQNALQAKKYHSEKNSQRIKNFRKRGWVLRVHMSGMKNGKVILISCDRYDLFVPIYIDLWQITLICM